MFTSIAVVAGPTSPSKTLSSVAAGAWGLLRNVFQEFAAFKWAGMDVDAASARMPAFASSADAFGIAYTSGTYASPRMLQQSSSSSTSGVASAGMGERVAGNSMVSKGKWVITGGLGGLGLLFAQWVALQMGQSVQLLDAAMHAMPAVLCQQAHAVLQICKADCGSSEEVAGAKQYGGECIGGVMHAAGVLQDALLLKQTASSFRAVLSGKVRSLMAFLKFTKCSICPIYDLQSAFYHVLLLSHGTAYTWCVHGM